MKERDIIEFLPLPSTVMSIFKIMSFCCMAPCANASDDPVASVYFPPEDCRLHGTAASP
jgi:hypothetical protein